MKHAGSSISARPAVTAREALVVLLILGVCVALFVVVRFRQDDGRRDFARSTVCLSNLHQFGVGLQVYAVQYKGYTPAMPPLGRQTWVNSVATMLELHVPDQNANSVPIDECEVFQCPTRARWNRCLFLDYVNNAMDPGGPDETNTWPQAAPYIRGSDYRKPEEVIWVCDAEREDRVVDFVDLPSVKTARLQQEEGTVSTDSPGIYGMTVWKGGHLPQGKGGINASPDSPGPRRAARQMHHQRFTNALFMDGHAQAVPAADSESDTECYAYWLRLFGVSDSEKVAAQDNDLY